MVTLGFDRSVLFYNMRIGIFPILRTSVSHGIPYKEPTEHHPSRERFTFWGFRRPERAIRAIPKTPRHETCAGRKAIVRRAYQASFGTRAAGGVAAVLD